MVYIVQAFEWSSLCCLNKNTAQKARANIARNVVFALLEWYPCLNGPFEVNSSVDVSGFLCILCYNNSYAVTDHSTKFADELD